MTVGELKKKLQDCPDDMLIGGSGYFGEYLECYSAQKQRVSECWIRSNDKIEIFAFDIESAGPEPD